MPGEMSRTFSLILNCYDKSQMKDGERILVSSSYGVKESTLLKKEI